MAFLGGREFLQSSELVLRKINIPNATKLADCKDITVDFISCANSNSQTLTNIHTQSCHKKRESTLWPSNKCDLERD